MRTWGRINQVHGQGGTWVEVTTDASGYNDQVYVTTLVQALKLNLGESPFFANVGIPAAQTIVTQVQPDYYLNMTQKQFAPFFASLLISREPQQPNRPTPVYTVNVITQQGSALVGPIPS